MKHQTITIPAGGNCAVGRNCRDIHLDYADGTSIAYHGEYGNDSTVDPNDLAALARAAGASGVVGRSVEVSKGFISGFTKYTGSYDADGVYTVNYGLD
jgi:hypothetical protein